MHWTQAAYIALLAVAIAASWRREWSALIAAVMVGNLAATMLLTAAQSIEPNLRLAHALDWALHKRWIGLDDTGRAIPKQRLSEGEKQIFAVSVLWGLSRAAARPLPAIIDTPMARLDGKHRDKLVERYFPQASHQVIVLSTDTEIERRYFHDLQPHIARAYHLNYDDQRKLTVAEEGYFWD